MEVAEGRNNLFHDALQRKPDHHGATTAHVLQVEYAEPAVRGNTATNLTKPVKLETGAEIMVPAFIEQGQFVKVDTRNAEYTERVKE